MAELLAQGKDPTQQWRQALAGQPMTLGRTVRKHLAGAMGPQDLARPRHPALAKRRLVRAAAAHQPQPDLLPGHTHEEFQVPPGRPVCHRRHHLHRRRRPGHLSPDLPLPSTELTCSAEELRQYKYVDADERIEVLAALPGVIRFSPSEAELEAQVAGVLLRGIPRAEDAAVLRLHRPPGAPRSRDRGALSSRIARG